jgi:putative lipase involved disintegration of autophagic bodies
VNGIDGRVQESLDFFDDVQMKYPEAKKWVCGHSL